MDTLENPFKHALHQGQPQIGFWLGLANPYTAEISAGAGFDWLLIDGEHAPNDVRSILEQLRAVAPYPAHAVVRPVNGDANLIKQLLDIGVQTLLVPMVESAEQAAALVRAMRYPPQGIRGVGTALARAARWNRTTNYLTQANAQMCLLVQVETVTGLENLESILTVPEVDGVFIGPADLAASMGYLGQAGHDQVKTAITQAIVKIRAAGKAAGILATDVSLAEHYIQLGANFVAVGVDTMLFAQGTASLAKRFKPNVAVSELNSDGAY
jgi:4-hydroxy-2-oxoheptanedioate aldolase